MIEIKAPDGSIVEFPDGTDNNTIVSAMNRHFGRLGEFKSASKGAIDSTLETLGAIPDAILWGTRQLGLTDTKPNLVTDSLKGLADKANRIESSVFPSMSLEGAPEPVAYGVGHGAADAASIFVPAAGVAKVANAASRTGRVAKALASAPALQTAAGAVGGGVTGATDSPLWGFLASLGTALTPAGARATLSRVIRPDLSNVSSAAPKIADKAASYVERIAGAAKKTPQDLINAGQSDLGAITTGAEALGRTGVGALSALGRRAGQTGDALTAQLEQRAGEMPDRILSKIADITGIDPAAARGMIEDFVKAKQEAASPLYKEAYAANKNISSPTLDRLLMTPSGRRAMSRAVKVMQDKRSYVGVPDPDLLEQAAESGQLIPWKGGVSSGMKLETYDKIKKALGDMYNKASAPLSGGLGSDEASGILDLKDKLTRELDILDSTAKAGPNSTKAEGGLYAKARATAGEYLSSKKAYEKGRGIIFSGNLDEQDVAKTIASMEPAEVEAFKGGVLNEIYSRAQNGRLKPKTLMTPRVQKKLAAIFGDQTQGLNDYVAQEDKLFQTGSKMMPDRGSPTAPLEAAMADQDNPARLLKTAAPYAKAVVNAGHGNWVSAAGNILGDVFDRISHPRITVMSPDVRDEAGRLLMQAPDQLGNNLMEIEKARKLAIPFQAPDSKDILAAALAAQLKGYSFSP